MASTPAPARFITLKSSQLEVTFDPGRGLPTQYRLPASQATIRGEDSGHDITALICRAEPRSFDQVSIRPESVRATTTRADFQFVARDNGADAAAFTLRYELKGAQRFYVSLEAVQEKPGFELGSKSARLFWPAFVNKNCRAWLAHGDTGGSTVMLADAKPGHLPQNRFWGGVAATLPVVMIGTEKALCVQEVTAFMDTTELAVDGEPGHRRAALGSTNPPRQRSLS